MLAAASVFLWCCPEQGKVVLRNSVCQQCLTQDKSLLHKLVILRLNNRFCCFQGLNY